MRTTRRGCWWVWLRSNEFSDWGDSMGLAYRDLHEPTRKMMIDEINYDILRGSIYLSNYLTDDGKLEWASLLMQAAATGSDDTLAHQLQTNGHIRQLAERRTKNGMSMVRVPHSAHETMAEGEFGRYYVRGLCRRAIADGIATLVVYRAKAVMQPRLGSEEKIGTHIDPKIILTDLRETVGVEPLLGLPPGPNSGLTLCIPSNTAITMN